MAVHFFSEGTNFNLSGKRAIKNWCVQAITGEHFRAGTLNYIFCTDAYLLDLNIKYLNHDTYTDVITFDYCEEDLVSGDIFISIERIKENALKMEVPFKDELHRVIIHGLLHLCGYKDKTPEEQREIRSREDFWLSLRSF